METLAFIDSLIGLLGIRLVKKKYKLIDKH